MNNYKIEYFFLKLSFLMSFKKIIFPLLNNQGIFIFFIYINFGFKLFPTYALYS